MIERREIFVKLVQMSNSQTCSLFDITSNHGNSSSPDLNSRISELIRTEGRCFW
jgi:hypothetical protein